jgi:colicin import membrane protein
MKPSRCRSLAALALLMCPLIAAPQDVAERSALQQERERITAQMTQQEAACQQRFAVTACVDDVKQRRRQALAPLRERELHWEDADRKQRLHRREELQAGKQQAHATAARSGSAGSAASTASSPRVVGRARQAAEAPAPERPAETPSPKPTQASERAAAAAQRVHAADARQAAAQATQAAVAKRQTERAARDKLPTPLPVPQPPAPARASSAADATARAGQKR